jgi:hypothetical protein
MNTDKEQAEILMGELVDFAEKMLGSFGDFHPFGGYLSEHEEVVQVGLSPSVSWGSDRERSEAISEALRSISTEKNALVAGIVTNVSMPTLTGADDAIRVFLEHKGGYCADVFFRYRFAEGRIDIQSVSAQKGVPHIFP